jgi:hypothetical protein
MRALSAGKLVVLQVKENLQEDLQSLSPNNPETAYKILLVASTKLQENYLTVS